jgi:hypothetical protein
LQDGEPQAIDALTSCYDDTSRPPLLSYKHIHAHLERAAAGQEQLPASQPMDDSSSTGQLQQAAADAAFGGSGSSMQLGSTALSAGSRRDLGFSTGSAGTNGSSGQLQYGSSGSYGTDALGSASLVPYQQQRQQQRQQLAGSDSWQVLFDGLEATQPAVTVSDTLLDFGCCSRLSPAEPQSFQVCVVVLCPVSSVISKKRCRCEMRLTCFGAVHSVCAHITICPAIPNMPSSASGIVQRLSSGMKHVGLHMRVCECR